MSHLNKGFWLDRQMKDRTNSSTWQDNSHIRQFTYQMNRREEANRLFQTLDGLDIDPQNKNRLKNAVGFQHRIGTILTMYETDDQAGVLSPFSQIDSTLIISGSPAKTKTFPFMKDISCAIMFSFPVDPFVAFMEITEPFALIKRQGKDYLSTLVEARGMECCCFQGCTSAELTTVWVDDGIHPQNGVCVLCKGHQDSANEKITLPVGARVYLFKKLDQPSS